LAFIDQLSFTVAPAYLADALQPVAQMLNQQWLRSSSTSAVDVPSTFNTAPYDWRPSSPSSYI